MRNSTEFYWVSLPTFGREDLRLDDIYSQGIYSAGAVGRPPPITTVVCYIRLVIYRTTKMKRKTAIAILEITTEQTSFLYVPTTEVDIEEHHRIRNCILL
jgi:hypothetical protein